MRTINRKPGSFGFIAAYLAGSDRSGLQAKGAVRVIARTLVGAVTATSRGMWSVLLRWQERQQMRRSMEDMDDRILKDVGMDRATLSRELSKPFWRS